MLFPKSLTAETSKKIGYYFLLWVKLLGLKPASVWLKKIFGDCGCEKRFYSPAYLEEFLLYAVLTDSWKKCACGLTSLRLSLKMIWLFAQLWDHLALFPM